MCRDNPDEAIREQSEAYVEADVLTSVTLKLIRLTGPTSLPSVEFRQLFCRILILRGGMRRREFIGLLAA